MLNMCFYISCSAFDSCPDGNLLHVLAYVLLGEHAGGNS